MNTQRWRKIEEIYNTAADLPASERQRHLASACDGDAALLREVEKLLALDEATGDGFDRALEGAIRGQAEELARDDAEPAAGRRFGAYRVSGIIARGGMGVVYRAVRDDEQFEKQVAIKVVQRGMGAEAVARFARERRILARLDHPNIARLLDGGVTDSGMPYVVMEYVDGLPVTDYCAQRELPVRERLEIFRTICAAVQDAHRNLVVHRDIKPSNILVTADGVPKLLDFGIAKLIDDELPEQTIALRLLTPDYASPEQVKGDTITTAADIYSLGAVLYELIAGRRAQQFKKRTTAEMEKVVCTEEPEPIPGELGSIVQMAMRKDPARRYATVEQFDDDVARYLDGEPIAARADTLVYRARKFVGRNRIAVAASALAVIALVAATTAALVQARRAQVRLEQVRNMANAIVFSPQLFRADGSMRDEEKLINTVVSYLDNLARESGGDPAVEHALARAYATVQLLQGFAPRGLGHRKAAAESNRKKIEIYQRLLDRNQNDEQALAGLAQGYADTHAIDWCRKALQIAEPRIGKPAFAFAARAAYQWIAGAQLAAGDLPAALETVAAAEKHGFGQANDGITQLLKADILHATGNLHAALDQTNIALASLTSLKTTGPQVTRFAAALPHLALGSLLGNPLDLNLGDRAAAMAHYSEAAKILRELAQINPRDADQSGLAKARIGIGTMLLDSDPAQALDELRTALASAAEDDRALCQALIGSALLRLHRAAEARAEISKALDLQPSVFAYDQMGDALLALNDRAGAEQAYQRALALAEADAKAKPHNMPSHRDLGDAYERLAAFHASAGQWREAREWYGKSLAVWRDWPRWGVSSEYDRRRLAAAERAVKKYGGLIRSNSPE